jgi:hypothetical protein
VRRITDAYDFPLSRVQLFKPAQSNKSTDLALDNFKNFVKTVFDKEGNYRHDIEYPAVMGNNCFNCNYCEFNDRHDICPIENRL